MLTINKHRPALLPAGSPLASAPPQGQTTGAESSLTSPW